MGGPPAGVVGLAMYVASRTAGCPYCSAHSCSFAIRRGAAPDKVAAALAPDRASFTRGELAAIAVARSLARIPCELTAGERAELVGVYGERNAEWIMLAAVMMGFLNKFMDAIGVELEPSVVSEVKSTMGPGWSAGKAGTMLDPAAPELPVPRSTAGGRRCDCSRSCLPLSASTAVGSAGRPVDGPRSAASSASERATTSRSWHGFSPVTPAVASRRCCG